MSDFLEMSCLDVKDYNINEYANYTKDMICINDHEIKRPASKSYFGAKFICLGYVTPVKCI